MILIFGLLFFILSGCAVEETFVLNEASYTLEVNQLLEQVEILLNINETAKDLPTIHPSSISNIIWQYSEIEYVFERIHNVVPPEVFKPQHEQILSKLPELEEITEKFLYQLEHGEFNVDNFDVEKIRDNIDGIKTIVEEINEHWK